MVGLDFIQRKDRSDPNRDDIPTAVLRQRRNLFVISFTLTIIYTAGLEFDSTSIEVFGITATIQNPAVIESYYFLWAIWIYFLWRYIQYLSFYGTYEALSEEYKGMLEKRYTIAFSEKVENEFPDLRNHGPSLLRNPTIYKENIKFHPISGSLFIRHGTTDGQYDTGKYKLRISSAKIVTARLISALYIIVMSRHFSDYYLPFLASAVPVILALAR